MKDLFGHQEIKALSWKEPFASLMLSGKVETRVWNTRYRGKVLICASKVPYSTQQLEAISGAEQIKRIQRTLGKNWASQVTGRAIALADLIEVRRMMPQDEDRCFVKYHRKLFCHVYENVQPIQPILWRGKQGWQKVPYNQALELLNQVNSRCTK